MCNKDVIEIKTTTGPIAIISKEDADLAQYSWWSNKGYIRGRINKKQVWIHRIIVERVIGRPLEKSENIDHINRNPLDNRRCNLRIATQSQNLGNRVIRSIDNKSGYKGVDFIERLNRWRATVGGKHIGLFGSPEEAAHAYDAMAIKRYGEFARLNFPNDIIEFHPKIIMCDNTTGYRGVSKDGNKWTAEFCIQRKRYRLCSFLTPQDAARAYDELAKQHLGDKAKLNFP